MRSALFLLACALPLAVGCSSSDPSAGSTAQSDAAASDSQAPEAGVGQDAADESAPDAADEAQPPHLLATIETLLGTIRVELDDTHAPITVDNFHKYADAQFYDGLIFHRVIPDFMIQGGGFEPGLKQRAALYPPIVDEASASGLSNLRGTIAMARTSNPDSATSQFFINTVDNTFLDPGGSSDPNGYAVFGKVVDGMDVVDQIQAVPTHTVGVYENVPVDDVVMQSVTVTTQ